MTARTATPFARWVASAFLLIGVLWLPAQTAAQAPRAAEAGAAAAGPYVPPTGPTPRTRSGKPDFSGVWEHPYVPDMTRTDRNPAVQKGPNPLPLSPAGLENIKNYDPARDGDYTGMCMPYGFVRSVNAPYPIQLMQSDTHIAFLFETNSWFHVVPFRDTHNEDAAPTWFGDSIARWDGDTLVVETVNFNGFTRLDTIGHPHSDKMRLTQRFTRTDAGHIKYAVTIDDPVYYTTPWTNERTFTLSKGDLFEYSCMENNRALFEGRIKWWMPPSVEPLRLPAKK